MHVHANVLRTDSPHGMCVHPFTELRMPPRRVLMVQVVQLPPTTWVGSADPRRQQPVAVAALVLPASLEIFHS